MRGEKSQPVLWFHISKNFKQILVTSYAKFLGMSSTDEWLNISEDEEKIAFNFIKNLEVNFHTSCLCSII